ncbi:hypothetical protein FQA47_003058 [Oryzias melastigma]|uniref:Uncharacterized protein n=1 Tax=Oryzias melastigma TaxID=30732 RepID=A0A834CE76_ORYME|nr:hypothetical protein FQA47_003058 [Oryzias melastigma]
MMHLFKLLQEIWSCYNRGNVETLIHALQAHSSLFHEKNLFKMQPLKCETLCFSYACGACFFLFDLKRSEFPDFVLMSVRFKSVLDIFQSQSFLLEMRKK